MKAMTQKNIYETLTKRLNNRPPKKIYKTLKEHLNDRHEREATLSLLQDLTPIGYQPLVKACHKISKLTVLSTLPPSVKITVQLVCSEPPQALSLVEERFAPLEYPHLLDQLKALLTDLELYLLPNPSTIEGLSWRLWIDVCRALLKELDRASEERSRLALILAGLSDELGHMVAIDMARLKREGPKIMARHLRALERAGHLQDDVILIMNEGAKFHSSQDAYELLDGQLGEVQAIRPIKREDEVILIMKTGLELYQADDKALREAFKDRHAEIQEAYVMTRCPPKDKGEPPFLIGQTQVTQALWVAVMGSNPSYFYRKGPHKPVEQVSWEDCVKFVNELSRKLSLTPAYSRDDHNAQFVEEANGFRLPLETEWEFAAHGGERFEFAGSDRLGDVGWHNHNSRGSTHDVGQLRPNAYGLYDMSGNVYEWCSNEYRRPEQYIPSDQGTVRGGSWNCPACICEIDGGRNESPNQRDRLFGLRLFKSLAS